MNDPKALRQVANDVGRAAAGLTEMAFTEGRDMDALASDLSTLRAAADICRRMARKVEGRKAQEDEKAPICLGCRQRTEKGGLGCALLLDTKEATARRTCKQYDPE